MYNFVRSCIYFALMTVEIAKMAASQKLCICIMFEQSELNITVRHYFNYLNLLTRRIRST